MRSRLLVLLGFLLLWAGAIGARLYELQVVDHAAYRERAERQQQRVVELDPARGTIYDARGRELAVSVAVDSAYAVPREIGDDAARQRTAEALAPLLRIPAGDLRRRLDSEREFVWIARKLDRPVATRVRELGLPGIYFLEESKRYFPMRELAAQVLGYVGTDNHGLGGLELLYDEEVAGTPARRTVLRDARRGTAVAPALAFDDAEPGSDLHLTLDASLQHIAERELQAGVRAFRARGGSVTVVDPHTGAVLAIASYPTFDPNHFNAYPASHWRNAAIMDAYEPGSTFKIVTAAAALRAGVVSPEDVFDCGMGSITLAGTRIGDHKPFGLLTLRQVIAKSSNVGAIKTGLMVGGERLHEMIEGLGFGRPTGIDLPGESAGIVRPLDSWLPLSKAYISFGQEISVTPLQLTMAVAAVANGGRLLEPYVVAAVGEGRQRHSRGARPVVRGTPIDPAVAASLEEMLEGVVVDGTARRAAVPGYAVAGKTGTAQKAEPRGGYSASRFVASFVGFAPARAPRLVALVVIDEPHPLIHGGEVAAPAFSAMASQMLLYLGVRPEREPLVRWPGEPEPAAPPVSPTPSDSGLLAALPLAESEAGAGAVLDFDGEGTGLAIADPAVVPPPLPAPLETPAAAASVPAASAPVPAPAAAALPAGSV